MFCSFLHKHFLDFVLTNIENLIFFLFMFLIFSLHAISSRKSSKFLSTMKKERKWNEIRRTMYEIHSADHQTEF